MGTVKAENYPDNGKCVSGYCTKINDKQNITLLHGRIQDIGGGGHGLYLFIGLTQTMLTIIKSFTVYNLTTVYGHRKGNCLNMLPVNMEM